MSRERALQRRLRTLATLDEAVRRAALALGAALPRGARAAPAGARLPRRGAALLAVLAPEPRPPPRATRARRIVLVAADLGLVGDYTRAARARGAGALRAEHGPGPALRRSPRRRRRSPAGVAPAVACDPRRPASPASRAAPAARRRSLGCARRDGSARSGSWRRASRARALPPVRVPVLPIAPAGRRAPRPSRPTPVRRTCARVVREYLYAPSTRRCSKRSPPSTASAS